MLRGLDRKKTTLLVPANDAEAVQIIEIAKKLGITLLVSDQPHGARLSSEPDLLIRLREAQNDVVVIVEIPGPGLEGVIKDAGFDLRWIDHHRYDDIDRMTDPETGEPQLSSLEQFLVAFDVSDDELVSLGFDPRMVRGVGAMDRGFIWALQRDGFSEEEVKQVSAYVRELARTARGSEKSDLNEKAAKAAWEQKKQVGEYLLVTSEQPGAEIRPIVSLMAAEAFGKPTPMIISSRSELVIYVQETPKALDLHKKFGGFTFGQDTCWGHNNATAKEKITLEAVLRFLT